MRRKFVVAIIGSVLAIATVIPTIQTLGQNSTNTKEQKAIAIVAKKLKVSVGELQVVNVVNVDDITRFKVMHMPTTRIESVNVDRNNGEISDEQVENLLEEKQSKNFKGKLEAKLKDSVDKSPQASSSVIIWVRTSEPAPKISRSGDKVAKQIQVEPFEEPLTVVPDSVKKNEVEALNKFHKSASEQVKKFIESSGGVVKYQAEYAPMLVAVVPNNLVAAIEQRNDVQSIELEQTYHLQDIAAQAIDAEKVWQESSSDF